MRINRRLSWDGMLVAVFLSVLTLSLLVARTYSDDLQHSLLRDIAKRDAQIIADSSFQALYLKMRDGWGGDDIDSIVSGLNLASPDIRISLYRADIVTSQFGPSSHAPSEFGSRVLASGQDEYRFDGDFLVLGRIIRAKPECLSCHTKSRDGAIHGALEVWYPMARIREPIEVAVKSLSWVIYIGLLLVFFISYFCVRFFVIRPMHRLAEELNRSSESLSPLSPPPCATSNVLEMVHIFDGTIGRIRDSMERSELARTIFENSPDGILVSDRDNRIVAANSALSEVTGYTEEELIGKTPKIFSSGQHDHAFYQSMWSALMERGLWSGMIVDRKKNGDTYRKWLKINVLKDEAGQLKNFISFHEDNTERDEIEERVRYLAHFDVLTGLPNRALLNERLEQSVLAATRNNASLALMFIDLDRFKYVNDTMGHGTGDKLLKIVAKRLKECVREVDTVARLGGDEFIILLRNPDISGVERVANEALVRVAEPCSIDGCAVQTRASIGIAMRTGHIGAEELVRRADVAMYHAKGAGKNTFRFYVDSMSKGASAFAMDAEIRQALEEGGFHVEYQPQVDASGAIVGVEALARWNHARYGSISPDEFIKAAEDCGLIVPLGEFILESAIRDASSWGVNLNGDLVHLSVNVSPIQLIRSDFPATVASALRRHNFDSKRLSIEVTESSLIDKAGDAVISMTAIRNLGIGVEIDDFGVGYSSLSYLKVIPATGIKLDRSFVEDIGQPHERLVAMIVDIARHLDLAIVAEGVATIEQANYLSGIGCDLMQGFYFSRSVMTEIIQSMVASKLPLQRE